MGLVCRLPVKSLDVNRGSSDCFTCHWSHLLLCVAALLSACWPAHTLPLPTLGWRGCLKGKPVFRAWTSFCCFRICEFFFSCLAAWRIGHICFPQQRILKVYVLSTHSQLTLENVNSKTFKKTYKKGLEKKNPHWPYLQRMKTFGEMSPMNITFYLITYFK